MKLRIFFVVFTAITIISFVPVYAQNIKTDLPVYTQGIEERNIKGTALTDSYNADILTKSSYEAGQKAEEYEKEQNKKLCDDLSLGIKNNELSVMSTLNEQNIKLFSKPCSYDINKNIGNNQKINTYLYAAIFIALGLISFLGTLALKKTERRKKNVHYSHNANGK